MQGEFVFAGDNRMMDGCLPLLVCMIVNNQWSLSPSMLIDFMYIADCYSPTFSIKPINV
jgi:hypothetical protein